MTKKSRNIILGLLGIALIVVITSPRVKLFEAAPANSPTAGAMMGLPVTAHVVQPEKVYDKIVASGTVLANEEVVVKSEIARKIDRIFFREGSRVRRGDVLVKINDDELQAELVKLESRVKLAEEIERRRRLLYETQSISPEDYEVALNELTSIRAEIQLAKARIDKTEIKAPFNGIIGLRYVSEGAFVTTDTRIATLLDVSSVKIDFAIPERYANEVRKGQKVLFTIAGTTEEHEATIYAIEPQIDPVTRTVQIRAIKPNPGGRIIPGAFAEVGLVLREVDEALMVPSEALIPELQGQRVFVYKGGVAQPQVVQTGIRTETRVQVVSGLNIMDTLITSGMLQLRPGMPVNITSWN